MAKQTILFTVLPRGLTVNPATFPVSVFVSPRLQDGDRLGQFPDWLDWTGRLRDGGLQLTFGCGARKQTLSVNTAPLRPDLWRAMFDEQTFVRSREFNDYTDRAIFSYPARVALSVLKSTYQQAGLALALPDRDPPQSDDDEQRYSPKRAILKELLSGLQVNWTDRDGERLREQYRRAFRGLGVTIVECDLAASLQEFRNCSRIINTAECYTIHERDYLERGHEMGVALRNKLDFGSVVAAADYLRAQRWRRALADEVERLFDQVDVILCAGTTRVAPDYEDRAGIKAFTGESAMAAFSLSGHPAISVCSGFSALGLPLNVQLAGRRFQDGLVAGTATALETAFALKDRRPPDPGAPPPAPAWTSEPAPQIALSERMLRARSAVGTVVSQLPQDLPKSLEPFVTVNTRSDHEVE